MNMKTLEAMRKHRLTLAVAPSFDDQISVALMRLDDRIDHKVVHYTNLAIAVEIMVEDAAFHLAGE